MKKNKKEAKEVTREDLANATSIKHLFELLAKRDEQKKAEIQRKMDNNEILVVSPGMWTFEI